jgi:hypothetical protein
MTSPKDNINLKGFKKVFSKFVQENEIGVNRQLRRSLTWQAPTNTSTSLTNSPARNHNSRTSPMEYAIRMDAYESPVISPRDRLNLRRHGKSEKDLKKYITLISPRLDRRNSLKQNPSEFMKSLDDQIKNLRSITSSKVVSKSNTLNLRHNSF